MTAVVAMAFVLLVSVALVGRSLMTVLAIEPGPGRELLLLAVLQQQGEIARVITARVSRKPALGTQVLDEARNPGVHPSAGARYPNRSSAALV